MQLMNNKIIDSLKMNQPTPHGLIELSDRDLRRLQENRIHLKSCTLHKDTKTIAYDSFEYGKNIKTRKVHFLVDEVKTVSDEIYLSNMKKKVMLITIAKDEAIQILPSLIISPSAHNSKPSGVLVLMMTVFKPIETNNNKIWNLDDCRRIKRCKPNIIHSSSHHQSSGYYVSIGNKGSLDKTTTSSVG